MSKSKLWSNEEKLFAAREWCRNNQLSTLDRGDAFKDGADWAYENYFKEALAEKDSEINKLKAKDSEFVEIMNKLVGSNNKENPHLGIAAGASLMSMKVEASKK